MAVPAPELSALTSPIAPNAFAAGENFLRDFIAEQAENFGADMEIAPGLWALLAVPQADPDADFIARSVLESAPFSWRTGPSADDAWTIYYVDHSTRPAARHWLDHLHRWLNGEPCLPSPQHLAELHTLLDSPMPHRVARGLVEAADRGELPPAVLRDRALIRALLDRMHRQEPTFLAAVLLLVEHHLIDLLELYRSLATDDLEIINELTQGNLSQDPFLLNRQTAAANLRRHLIEARILNPLDQRKHTDASNPYTQLTRLRRQPDGSLLVRVDGIDQELDPVTFRESLAKVRQRTNRGIDCLAPDSRAPWATDERAYHLRFIRQLAVQYPQRRTADILHMIDRALEN